MAANYKGMLIGYARTSTADQQAGLEAQLRDLEAAGCQKTFREQRSSVDSQRVELAAAMDFAREGDTLVVTKLDRLARSVANLVDIQRQLDARGVALRILSINLDTSTPTGKLMVNMIGAVAQFERELMLERQCEGIAKAKREGKYKGRAPTAQRKAKEIVALRAEGRSVPEIVTVTGISRASIFRVLRSVSAKVA